MDMRTARAVNTSIEGWRREVLLPLTKIEQFIKNLPRYKTEKQKKLANQYLEAVRITLNDVWAQETPEPAHDMRKTLVLLLYAWERTLVELLVVLDETAEDAMPDLFPIVKWQTDANDYYQRYNAQVENMQLALASG